MTRYHPTFRAQQTVLAAAIANNGAEYVAASHSAAHKFRAGFYQLRKLLRRKSPNGTSPYDNVQFSLPRKGEPDDNIITITILKDLPAGTLRDLSGRELPLTPDAPIAEAPSAGADPDLALSDLFETGGGED